jgi:MFS family permease
VSLPYGALAYRIGRGRVLLLALVGCVLGDVWTALVCEYPLIYRAANPETHLCAPGYFHLPIRTVWLSSVFQLVGGGAATVLFMCYAVVGNAYPPEKR